MADFNKNDWVVVAHDKADIVILQLDFSGYFDNHYLRHAKKEDFEKFPITIFSKLTTIRGRIDVLAGMDKDKNQFKCKKCSKIIQIHERSD